MTEKSLLGFEYQALIEDTNLGGSPTRKSVGFQTTLSKDCTQEELDSLLDKCRLAVMRQQNFAAIERDTLHLRLLEEDLVNKQKNLSDKNKEYAERAEKHEGRAGRGLSHQEQTAMNAEIASLEDTRDRVKKIREKISTLHASVGCSPSH